MYRVHTHSLEKREKLIEQGVKASKETYPFYEHQNRKTDLPIVRLDINVPVYRMENYRTRTAQLKFVHDAGKPPGFFFAGRENESAQQAQHEILVRFAKQGRAASVAPIMDELRSEEQREPLLISASGVVVNGNRRLAAMRELFAEGGQEYRHFSHVDCAVLPHNITPEEVREIEVRLQMRPETKLPYGWVNESLAIRELLESGKKLEYVADLMNKRKKDVERAASALTEAEIYLKEWLREPGEYQYIEDAEQFFGDLAKALEGKHGEELEASRRIAWALIANSKQLHRRVYDYNFSFDKRTDEVVAGLVDRLEIDLSSDTKGEDADQGDLDIDLAEDDEGDTSLEPLIDAFDDPSQRDDVAQELVAVCDAILERDRQGETGRRALSAVQAANNKLHEVDLTKADPATYDSIEMQLNSVLSQAQRLRQNLHNYKNDTGGS